MTANNVHVPDSGRQMDDCLWGGTCSDNLSTCQTWRTSNPLNAFCRLWALASAPPASRLISSSPVQSSDC